MSQLTQFGERLLNLSSAQVRRLMPFLLLGITLKISDLAADTLATSLFLAHAGAEYLPLAYIFLGVTSVPFYLGLSHVVDSLDRTRLLGYLLGGSVLVVLGLRLLIETDAVVSYYAAFIFGGYLWEGMVIDVLFPSLVSDYFTMLDYKRYAWLLASAMAIGGIIGGGLTGLLAIYFTPKTLLLYLPILYGLVGIQVYRLQRTESPLGDNEDDEVALGDALKTLPQRFRHHPIAAMLIFSTLLQVILSTLAEFQYLDIYSRTMPSEQALTQLFSYLAVAFSVLELVVLYCFTQPLIKRLGIPRMNLLYPLTTLLSFGGLVFNGGLPAAIALNFNADTLDKSIEEPVYTLNYNALPSGLVGQVRAVSDGLFYSVGIAVAGGLLWGGHSVLSPLQMISMGLVLSALLVVLHYYLGQEYLHSLQAMLKKRLRLGQSLGQPKRRGSGRTPWSRRRTARSLLPLIRIALRDSSSTGKRDLLNTMAKIAKPGSRELVKLALAELNHLEPQVVIAAIRLLGNTRIRAAMPPLATQLHHPHSLVRAAAARALASYGEPSLALSQNYLRSPQPEVVEAAIVAIGQVRSRRAADILYGYLKPDYERFTSLLNRAASSAQHKTLVDEAYQHLMARIVPILSSLEGEDAITTIFRSLQDANIRVRANALELLASLRHRRFVLPIFSLIEDQVLSGTMLSSKKAD